MAAGLGFKTFTTGEVLTAADVNGYLMQGVLVFASEAARNSAITSPQEGQFAYTKDNNSLWYYTGSAWAASGATGDIEGVTAGTGISGGGTSGTVTITNSMATEITAKADLIVGTGNATFDNLPVGANGTVLTADSTVSPTGLKWDTPATGGYTSIASGSFSGASVSITGIAGTYRDIVFIWRDYYFVNDDHMTGYVNGTTGIYTNQVVGNGDAPMTTTYFVPTQNESTDNTDQNNFLMMRFYDYANSSSHKIVDSWVIQRNSANTNYRLLNTTTGIRLTAAINSITFGTQTGANISGGTYSVYGVK